MSICDPKATKLARKLTKMHAPLPAGYRSTANAARLKMLAAIANETSSSPQQVMLAWLWSKPQMLPMIAVSSKSQLADNIKAMKIKLTDDQVKRLEYAGD
jgi:aryl-alcohol dehydrogenase-like predicted oxidoreductase